MRREPMVISESDLARAAEEGEAAFRHLGGTLYAVENPYTHRTLRWAWELGWRRGKWLALADPAERRRAWFGPPQERR